MLQKALPNCFRWSPRVEEFTACPQVSVWTDCSASRARRVSFNQGTSKGFWRSFLQPCMRSRLQNRQGNVRSARNFAFSITDPLGRVTDIPDKLQGSKFKAWMKRVFHGAAPSQQWASVVSWWQAVSHTCRRWQKNSRLDAQTMSDAFASGVHPVAGLCTVYEPRGSVLLSGVLSETKVDLRMRRLTSRTAVQSFKTGSVICGVRSISFTYVGHPENQTEWIVLHHTGLIG